MSIGRSMVARCLFAVLIVSVCGLTLRAQSDVQQAKPYAAMDRSSVSYEGPGRGIGSDIGGETTKIGVILPLDGPGGRQGKLLLQAAQIAIDEANATGAARDGRRFSLAIENESGQWGQASSAIVRLIMQNEAVAVITSTEGSITHQAEQIANKIGAPILTLSSDSTTTRINIPWIFRVGPSDAEQARAIAADILRSGVSRRVLLIVEAGHDGRVGADEFAKAVTALGVTVPERLEINSVTVSTTDVGKQIAGSKAKAIVVWSGPELAEKLLQRLEAIDPSVEIYLCQKAAGFLPSSSTGKLRANTMTVVERREDTREEFVKHFREQTGEEAGMAAEQSYDAVMTVIRAVREVGPNRARLRDFLSSEGNRGKMAQVITFDAAGNRLEELRVVSAKAAAKQETKPEQK